MSNFSESELLRLIQRDDREAFAQIVNFYHDILLRFINKRISNIEDSKDILQEVFISLWHRRNHIVIEETFYPYLFKSAQYQVIDYMINKKGKILRSSVLLEDAQINLATYSSEDEYMAKELNDLIKDEIENMPKTMKKSFEMSRKEALPIKDIAEKLSLSEQTIKNSISMAISRLRIIFK